MHGHGKFYGTRERLAPLCPRPAVFNNWPNDGVLVGEAGPRELEAKIPKWMEVYEAAYEAVKGFRPNLSKIPLERKRLLAVLGESTIAHHRYCNTIGALQALVEHRGEHAQTLRVGEAVTTDDIADWTTQSLAYIVDIFAPTPFLDLVTTIAMTGPTAYVHTERLTRDSDCGYYTQGDALVDGLDPSCAECPTECHDANLIGVEVSPALVTAECWRLAGEICIPANYAMQAQYGRDINSVILRGIGNELMRVVNAVWATSAVANASQVHTYTRVPLAGSFYATADPNLWRQQLWTTFRTANRAALAAPNGRASLTHLAGDISGLGILEDAVPMELHDEQPGDVTMGSGDEYTAFYGVTKQGRVRVYRFLEGMPEDTLLALTRRDRDPVAIYAPWIPITSLGTIVDPVSAQIRIGAIHLAGMAFTRTQLIHHISIV